MDRKFLLLAGALAAVLSVDLASEARADRLGGNYRGPGDTWGARDAARAGEGAAPAPAGGSDATGNGEAPPAGPSDGGGDAPPPEDDSDAAGEDPPPPPGQSGGQYRGPAGEAPPDARQPEDAPPPDGGGGEPTPPDSSPPPADSGGGSGGGTTGGPSSTGGSSGPGAPSGGSGGGTASPGRGGPADDRDRIWPFYFEGAKEEYLLAALARRDAPRLSPPRTSTWALSLQPEGGRALRALPSEAREAVLAVLHARLRDADSRVRDAAVIALGKSGEREAVPYLRQAASRDPDPAVQEDALLALGLSGDREEALPALRKALRRRTRVDGPRSAAFAALGLGLLGDPSAAPALRDLFRDAAPWPARADDAAAAATALGLLGDAEAIPHFEKALASRGTPIPVKCAVLHALGKYGARDDDATRRAAFAAVTAALGQKKDVRQSALLALGAFADAGSARLLVREGLLDPDAHCRNFAAHSLGRIASRLGPSSREFALAARELEKAASSEVRDRWLFQAGNLALASMAAGDRERPLLGVLEGQAHLNLHSASSAAISLGLLGPASPETASRLRTAFQSRAAPAPVRAYAGLALALSGAPGSSEALARVLAAEEKPPAEVARTAALGLGLAGGDAAMEVLVAVLERSGTPEAAAGDSGFVLGAAVQGLGLLGDETLVERLRPLASDPSWARRAFATAALGYLVESDPSRRAAPRLSEVFRHHNYRMPLPVIRAVQSAL